MKNKILLILGNGYHLNHGYKTSWKDFMFFVKNSDKYLKVDTDQFFEQKRCNYDPLKKDLIQYSGIEDFFENIKYDIKYNFEDIEYINKFKNSILYKLFNSYILCENPVYWSDLEELLQKILNDIYSYYHHNETKKELYEILIDENKNESELLNKIYEAVKLFENAFAAYLLIFNVYFKSGRYVKHVLDSGNGYIHHNTNDNLRNYLNGNTKIISFNYFNSDGDDSLLFDIKDFDLKNYINIHNTVECNREFDKRIIIGIQDGIFSDNLYRKFEKVQRLNEIGIDINEIIDSLADYNHYIVFGHSFGKSDYYFFSTIIGNVLKNENVKLTIFYYGNRDSLDRNIIYYIKDSIYYKINHNIKFNIEYRIIV